MNNSRYYMAALVRGDEVEIAKAKIAELLNVEIELIRVDPVPGNASGLIQVYGERSDDN